MLPEDIKYQLKRVLSAPLPGDVSHLKMVPPGRSLAVSEEQSRKLKKSSVLVVLYSERDELYCIMIKRPATMKFHAGQIAFPGGAVEEYDSGPIEAALREAREEVGIVTSSVEIIGQLTGLATPVSLFSILPVVGWCGTKPDLKKNPHEVEKILKIPLNHFLNGENMGTVVRDTSVGRINVPCYFYGGEAIWGASAMILSELIDTLSSLPYMGIAFT